jgi:hypothetical protein
MLVGSSIHRNARAAKPRGLSQVEKRYVSRGRSQANVGRERAELQRQGELKDPLLRLGQRSTS